MGKNTQQLVAKEAETKVVRDVPGKKFRVGFIPATLELYYEIVPEFETLLAGFAAQIRDSIKGDNRLDVEFAPVCANFREFQENCNFFESRNFDLLVLCHFSYSPSGEIVESLINTRLPVLLWPA